jgi:hypothetical protein
LIGGEMTKRQWVRFSLLVNLFVLIGLMGIVQSSHSQSTWFQIGETEFPGGFGQSLASDGENLFILRQFLANTRVHFQHLALTDGIITQTSNLEPPPHNVQNGAVITPDPEANLYVMYGADYFFPRKLFGKFSAGKWTDLADTPMDQGPGNAMTFVLHEGQRYMSAIVGAAEFQRPEAQTGFLRYHITSDTWDRMPKPPWDCSDDGSALAWDGGDFVYAFQGSDCNDQPTFTFARFFLTLGLWEQISFVPDAVDNGASLVWDRGNYLYAVTGSADKLQGRGFYRYDLQAQAWDTSLGSLNCSVGDYNGNRLIVLEDRLIYWQGTPPTWNDNPECNGMGIYASALP